jgi:hypothetical protein
MTAMQSPTKATVVDAPDRRRFELAVDGNVVGFLDYRRRPGVILLTHTEVDPSCAGQGLGTVLITAALDIVRAQGLSVLPYCPFVARFIARHREYLDLVPRQRRSIFALERE